jgi:4-hydroxy-tetrahydrodipicolinate synthase
MLTGCGTALVTPFRREGGSQEARLDEVTLRKLVRRQIEQGIDFLVPCGTTGESPTLTLEEHLRVVSITVEEAAKRVPVVAGAGGNNTHEVVELARECERAGADALLSVTPYYNKPSQEGLYQHYKAIANATSLPIVVYSVQGRTSVNVEPGTLERLAEIDNIVGVKEASGNITQIAEICCRMPERFTVLSGDDVMTLPVISVGGRGVISTSSNQIPGPFTEMTRLALAGDYAGARKILKRWLPLMNMNFIETNPIAVKWAMAAMGLLEPVYRLPIVPPSEATKKKVEQVVEAMGLLATAGAHVAG